MAEPGICKVSACIYLTCHYICSPRQGVLTPRVPSSQPLGLFWERVQLTVSPAVMKCMLASIYVNAYIYSDPEIDARCCKAPVFCSEHASLLKTALQACSGAALVYHPCILVAIMAYIYAYTLHAVQPKRASPVTRCRVNDPWVNNGFALTHLSPCTNCYQATL